MTAVINVHNPPQVQRAASSRRHRPNADEEAFEYGNRRENQAYQQPFRAPESPSPPPVPRHQHDAQRARSLSHPRQHHQSYQPFTNPTPVTTNLTPVAAAPVIPRKQKHKRRRARNRNAAIAAPVMEPESRGGYEYPRTPSPPPAPVLVTTVQQQPATVYSTTQPYHTYRPKSYYYGPNSSTYRKSGENKILTTVGEPAPPSRHFGINSRFIHTIKKLPLGWTKHSIVTTGQEPETGVVTTVKQNILTNEDKHRRKYLRRERKTPAGVYEEYPRYKWYCRPRPANTSAYAWTLVIAGLFNLACGFFMVILAYNAQGDSGTILLWKILGPIGLALGLIFLLIGLYLLYYYYKYDRKNNQARKDEEEAARADAAYYKKHPSAAPSYTATTVPYYSTYGGGRAGPPHHYEHLHSVVQPQPLKSALSVPSRNIHNNSGFVDDDDGGYYSQPLTPQQRKNSVRYREPPAEFTGPAQPQADSRTAVYAKPAARPRN